MATSFLTDTEKTTFKDALTDHFETFKQTITVHKEPKRNTISRTASTFAGYGPTSNTANITLVPVNSTFDAIITNERNPREDSIIGDLHTSIPVTRTRIKVKVAAKNYIDNGKTECIEINNKKFNLITSDGFQIFLGDVYYLYALEETQ